MGGQDPSNSDGSFTGDSSFSVCPAPGKFSVLSDSTSLPGRLPNGLDRPAPGNDGFRSQVSEFDTGHRLDQAKLAIRRMDANIAAKCLKKIIFLKARSDAPNK
jgi:hypothetical protein